LMGATILGDGRVAPIIDVTALAELNLFSVAHPANKTKRGGSSAMPIPAALSAPAGRGASTHGLV
jgi:hypothetical protein